MTLPNHRMSMDMFTAIARGRSGVAAVQALRGVQESKVKILLREIVERAAGPQDSFVAPAYDLLAVVSRDSPGALRTVLRHPVVGAWAVEAARADHPAGAAGPARMAYVAAAAAILSGARHELVLPSPRTREQVVPLPVLGHVTLGLLADGRPLLLRTGSGSAELVHDAATIGIGGDDPRWTPVTGIAAESGGLRLELLMDQASWLLAPDLTGNGKHRIEALGSSGEGWAGHVDRAWRVLTVRHRAVAEEAAATYTMLTPLASPPRGQNSGTYEDAFGCLAMSPPSSPVTGAAAIAHELRHAELALLMDLFALVEPDDEGLYYAPWRPDPRPVRGLLHGVYAHLGLSAFWAIEAQAGGGQAEVHLARWRRAAGEGAYTLLAEARLTPLGRRFVSIVRDELARLSQVPVSAAADALARREADAHRREWTRVNCPDRPGGDPAPRAG